MERTNSFGQPLGPDLGGWTPPTQLDHVALRGSYAELHPLVPSDGARLFQHLRTDDESIWTYMSFGPFRDRSDLETEIETMVSRPDWLPYIVLVAGEPHGFLSYLRLDIPGGVVEIGSIVFDASLRRTTAATEAIFLLIDHAIESGFRRVEWKCDDMNIPSIRAASRFGFTYEGTFRQATHYKGRNRDTAWYAILDKEWPGIRAGFLRWLDPVNFDESGTQIQTLEECRAAATN